MADATNSAGRPRSAPDSMRKFTERQVSAALGLVRLELYLVAADLRIGRHDPLTHLKVFTVDEVERIAARLGLPPPRLEEQLAEESAMRSTSSTVKTFKCVSEIGRAHV